MNGVVLTWSCFSCLMSSSEWSRMAAILVWSWPAYRSAPAAAPSAISSRKLLCDDLKRFTGCSSLQSNHYITYYHACMLP